MGNTVLTLSDREDSLANTESIRKRARKRDAITPNAAKGQRHWAPENLITNESSRNLQQAVSVRWG